MAVQSKFPNVGGIVPWARAGVGAVATQSLANTAYGEVGLDLMARGATAEEALRIVMRTDSMLQDRQVGIVDARGNAASFTGGSTFDWAGGRVGGPAAGGSVLGGKGAVIVGRHFAAQANIMVSDQTVKNMAEAFETLLGTAGRPADDGAPGGPGGRWGQAGHAVGGAAGRPRPRRLPRGQRPVHRYPGLRRRGPDRGARPAADASTSCISSPASRPISCPITPEIVRQLEPILLREPRQPARQVAQGAPGQRPIRSSLRRSATSCTGRTTTSGYGWTARSTGWCWRTF